MMLRDTEAFSGFSVNDLQVAQHFYEQTLGLNVSREKEGLALKISGGQPVFIYPKPDHTPASFTILNFLVVNIDSTVQELKNAGIQFEQYEGDIKTDESGVFRGQSHNLGGPDIAWFKDPAGNILSIIQKQ